MGVVSQWLLKTGLLLQFITIECFNAKKFSQKVEVNGDLLCWAEGGDYGIYFLLSANDFDDFFIRFNGCGVFGSSACGEPLSEDAYHKADIGIE